MMETATAIRDGVFWWIGNWTLFTALDLAGLFMWNQRRKRREAEDAAAPVVIINRGAVEAADPDGNAD